MIQEAGEDLEDSAALDKLKSKKRGSEKAKLSQKSKESSHEKAYEVDLEQKGDNDEYVHGAEKDEEEDLQEEKEEKQ